jgi:hypothetical protein
MERITYRKTLDVHKNGVQFMLQGFETADKMSRVIEISLMASGDAIDFPLERMVAMMYVTTPSAKEPSINECTIKDNKVVYEVLPIVEEGITEMQLKLIETSPKGATSVLASPKFSVEVAKSGTNDDGAELKTTFTAIEKFIAKADAAYGSRLERIELDSECIFKAYYADGSTYETDVLRKLFLNGNVLLSESYAHGGTGVRAGEDTDNSKYYSNVAKSEALNAKDIMENSEDILEEVKLHGVYTAFSVDFNTGEVEYVSPSFKFKVNPETGELDAEGQTYTFEDEIGRVVEEWLGERGVILSNLQEISTRHTEEIEALQERDVELQESVDNHTSEIKTIGTEIRPFFKNTRFVKTAEFKEAGIYTWTPTEEDLMARFIVVGAGAGGGAPTQKDGHSYLGGYGGGGGAVIITDIMSLEPGVEIPIEVGLGGAGGLGGLGGGSYEYQGKDGGNTSCMGIIAPGGKGCIGGTNPVFYIGDAWKGADGALSTHPAHIESSPRDGGALSIISPIHPHQSFSAGGGSGGFYYPSNPAHFSPGKGGMSQLGSGGYGGDSTSETESGRVGRDGANGCGGGGGASIGRSVSSGYVYDCYDGGKGGDGYVAIYTLKKTV